MNITTQLADALRAALPHLGTSEPPAGFRITQHQQAGIDARAALADYDAKVSTAAAHTLELQLLDALRDLRSRYVVVFDAYQRPTYHEGSNPDTDLSLALYKTDEALLRAHEARAALQADPVAVGEQIDNPYEVGSTEWQYYETHQRRQRLTNPPTAALPADVSDDYQGVSKTFDIAATQDEWSAHLAACKDKPTDEAPPKGDDMRAALLWALYHHQGGSSGVGQVARRALGMGQHQHMTDEQIREATRYAALQSQDSPT